MAAQEFEVVAKLRIRQAKIEDAKDLQTYCFPAQDLETVTQSLTADLEQAESKDVVRLVADASGHAVGQIRIERKSSESTIGHLGDLLVSSPFRVFGISGKLIEVADKAAYENGLSRLQIELPQSETAIIEAYERWGFTLHPVAILQKETQPYTEVQSDDKEV